MAKLLLITTTVEQKEDAERIANLLLAQRLIACAQISAPVTSIYRWKGETAKATEWILSMKTIERHYSQIEKTLLREHPYEIPEIVAQEIPLVSETYGSWLLQEVV